MYEELFRLLGRLGLGAAAQPLCDLLADLVGESMSLQQLRQEITNVLRDHAVGERVDAVIAAIAQIGLVALSRTNMEEENDNASGAGPSRGASLACDSALLAGNELNIVVEPRAPRAIHETARGWLDIDGGIYFDVRQHGARTE